MKVNIEKLNTLPNSSKIDLLFMALYSIIGYLIILELNLILSPSAYLFINKTTTTMFFIFGIPGLLFGVFRIMLLDPIDLTLAIPVRIIE